MRVKSSLSLPHKTVFTCARYGGSVCSHEANPCQLTAVTNLCAQCEPRITRVIGYQKSSILTRLCVEKSIVAIMVIDTSALIAILLEEPDAEAFAKAIADDPKRLISAFTALEAGIVIEAKKGEAGEDFSQTDVQPVAF